MKVLGVHFSNDLRWDVHVTKVKNIANSRFFALRCLRPLLSKYELCAVYYALIRSIVEYCCPLFVGINHKNSIVLESIQRRFHNLLCSHNCKCDLLPTLVSKRNEAAKKLYLTASTDSSHILHSVIPKKSRRKFIQPISKTERRLKSFIPYTTILCNN